VLPLKAFDGDREFKAASHKVLKDVITSHDLGSMGEIEAAVTVLLHAGFIWDDSLTSSNINPLLGFTRSLFPVECYDLIREDEAQVSLMTPKSFVTAGED